MKSRIYHKFEVELNNKSKIKVIGYNKIADKCYKELEKEDTIWIEGRIEEKQIVIKELIKIHVKVNRVGHKAYSTTNHCLSYS